MQRILRTARLTTSRYREHAARMATNLNAAAANAATATTITPSVSSSAWRTRMEFLTSTVNLPLNESVQMHSRPVSPAAPAAVDERAIVFREPPQPLVPCPLPQPLEEMMASDDEDDESYRSSLQRGVSYW